MITILALDRVVAEAGTATAMPIRQAMESEASSLRNGSLRASRDRRRQRLRADQLEGNPRLPDGVARLNADMVPGPDGPNVRGAGRGGPVRRSAVDSWVVQARFRAPPP